MHPKLKIIHDSGCQSYLIGCPETGEALAVDPKVGRTADLQQAAAERDLRIVGVLDTHTHADHLSSSTQLMGDDVPLWMSVHSECARPRRDLREGDELQVGALRFRVLEVPGHTPDSLALHGHGMLLAGDTLFVGGLARADFRGSDPARLFESVQRKIMTLPDDTLVFPGHGYNDILFTTVGTERQSNPALQHDSGEAYARSLGAVEGAGNTAAVDTMLAMNLEARPILPETQTNVAACCAAGGGSPGWRGVEVNAEEVSAKLSQLASRHSWVDVRDPAEFAQARIPGTVNVPLSELGFHLKGLGECRPLYLSCRSGVRSLTAARTLHYLGVVEEPISVKGGILRWQEHGLAMEGPSRAT